MSEQEMNSYRFISGLEPSDEMLSQLMKEVAQDAIERQNKATSAYFNEMYKAAEIAQAKWSTRINQVLNG
ncbi:MAG: hypothetical protein ACI304_09655 [Lepagella sp.]